MANRLEMVVEVDSSGAVKSLQVLQGKAGETADKINKSFSDTSFDKFTESVRRGIEDPLGAAANAAKGMLSTLGPVGTGLAAAGAAFGAFALAGFEAAKALGEYGDALEDTATRMGLSVKETAQFSFAMKYAGGSIESLEASMRMLSQGLNDSTEDGKKAKEGLKELGIEARDSVTGKLRPMSQIFVELSEKLGGIEDVAKRNTIAIQVLGRAGLQVLPDLLELSEGVKRANEIGIKGPSPEELRKWKEYHHQVVEFETEWAKLKRDTMQPIAATVMVSIKNVQTGLSGMGAFGSALVATLLGQGLPEKPYETTDTVGPATKYVANRNKAQIEAVLNRWGMTKDGLEAALSEAKKNESEALAKLNAGDVSAIGDFQKATGRVSSLEARIKGIADAKTQAAKVAELIRKYNDTAQDPIRKLYQDIAADSKGLTGKAREEVQAAGIGAILREDAKRRQKEAEEAGKAAKEMADAFEKTDDTIREMMAKSTGFGIVPAATSNPTADMMRVLGKMTPVGPQMASAEQQVSSLSAAEQAQERIVQLLAGPGGEVAAIGQISAMRASLAAQERAIAEEKAASITDEVERSKALYDAKFSYEEKLAQVQRDNAIQLLELRKKQEDDYVNAVVGGARALRSGGVSSLGSFAGSQLWGLAETGLGNLTRMGTRALGTSGFGLDPNSLFGKIFAGSPLVKAGDVQMTAAQMQLRAATTFAGAMGMPVSGVPFGGLMGALPSMFPGGTFGGGMSRTNPFIWSYQARGTNDIVGDNGLAIPGTGTGTSPALNGTFVPNSYYLGPTRLAQGVGAGIAAAGGAFGAYQGIQQGGFRGAMTASGSIIGSAGGIIGMIPSLAAATGPLAPILAGVGALLAFTGILGPDPKKKYAEREQRMLDSARYEAPESTNYTFDQSGKAYDYDYRGNMRTYVTQNVTIQAMDAQSFQQFATRNGDVFAETIRKQIPNHGGLRMGIQAAVNP